MAVQTSRSQDLPAPGYEFVCKHLFGRLGRVIGLSSATQDKRDTRSGDIHPCTEWVWHS